MACGMARPSKPTTPVTALRTAAGTSGACVLTSDPTPPGSLTRSSGVAKAEDTVLASPLTGSSTLPRSGACTWSPSARRAEVTSSTSAALGPYCAANCDALR